MHYIVHYILHHLLHHILHDIGAGFSGFFVNITSFLLVKRTSSMTFKLLTMMRNGGLVLASGVFFGETSTPRRARTPD